MMFFKLAAGNVRRSAKDFALYFITVVFGVSVFYAFNSIADQDAVLMLNEQGGAMLELLGMMISGVSVLVMVILAFLVIYADRFLMQRRKKEFAIYLTLGMHRGQLARVVALETLILGTISLAVGILLGILLSQVLMHITASFFGAEIPGVSFMLSMGALVRTFSCFAVIFLLTTISNSGVIMRTRLIKLLAAAHTSEKMKLRSIPLSFALFVISCILIGISYKLLLDNGLLSMSPGFITATVLVVCGTFLFFYSISGFLLRAIQLCRPLYLRGLSMFSLRQLNARVNSNFFSMSIICIILFLALISVCGGIGICTTLQKNMETTTRYEGSVSNYWMINATHSNDVQSISETSYGRYAADLGFNMEEGMRQSATAVGAPAWDSVVKSSAQVDFYNSRTIDYGTLDALAHKSLMEYMHDMVNTAYETQSIQYISLSQYNAALTMAGLKPLHLGADECMFAVDSDLTSEWLRDIASGSPVLDVEGTQLRLLPEISEICIETTSIPMQTGALVVPDEHLPENLMLYRSVLNVNFVPDNANAADQFSEICSLIQTSTLERTWPVNLNSTREQVWEQNMGITAIIGYLAAYIGFVLVIASAAILGLQQLSAASENAGRYALLNKLGASRNQISTSILVQVGVCFAFPLLLALAHTICAFQVVSDVVKVFGYLDISATALTTAGLFLMVYGFYFLITCIGSINLARSQDVKKAKA